MTKRHIIWKVMFKIFITVINASSTEISAKSKKFKRINGIIGTVRISIGLKTWLHLLKTYFKNILIWQGWQKIKKYLFYFFFFSNETEVVWNSNVLNSFKHVWTIFKKEMKKFSKNFCTFYMYLLIFFPRFIKKIIHLYGCPA